MRARLSSALLLRLLYDHHAEPIPEPAPAEPLPPITNADFELAHKVFNETSFFSQVEKIQSAVLLFYPDITIDDLRSKRRTDKIVRPRQIVMYLAKELTTRSLREIGRRCGVKDHSTVLHAWQKIGRLTQTDTKLAEQLETIKGML